jgi:hypothetical protein
MGPRVVAEQNETQDEPDDPDDDAEPEHPDGGAHVGNVLPHQSGPDQSWPATEIKPTSVATRTAAIRVPTPSFR